MLVSILHPFTPQAAGVVEKSVATYHSQPHLKALQQLVLKCNYTGCVEYFTPKWKLYSQTREGVKYTFYPVSFTLNKDHTKWKKQKSSACLRAYKKHTPDVTIINMSGHSSPFSYELSKVILKNKKEYIAMLGGQHYTDTQRNRDYYKNAHHILVHTHIQKKEMEQMELFKSLDIRVFPLGVDCTEFKPLEKKNPSPKLLYVGRIVEWKRIHLAIDAVKKLVENGFPKASLDIIGPVSSENYLSTLHKQVRKLGIEKNVNFLGHKEHHQLPSYFQQSDLFTLPSDKETFGMVMIEAMACGTPVAGIDCPGGPKDVITHLKNGLLSSPENYSQTVLEYFKNKEIVLEIEKNAHQKVLNEYNIDATYKVLKQSIETALHEK